VIRVVVADDQDLVREGFRLILDLQDDMEVVGEAGDGRAAVELARLKRPDVVLMDVEMPGMNGIEATRVLLGDASPPRVLILTTFDSDAYLYEAMKAGAAGFLLKDAGREQLTAGIRAVHAGESLIAPAMVQRLVERFVDRPAPATGVPQDLAEASERELEVMKLVARGLSNAEIAESLVLGEATVKSHVASLLRKLQLRDRVQLVVAAYESGLVEPGG
jgi:DNA-binding NarL/FixJ family response regulator